MRRQVLAAALIGTLALVGCSASAKTIEGSVETVVTECQDVATDESVAVEVTGNAPEWGAWLADEPEEGNDAVIVLYSDDEGTYVAFCMFEEISQDEIDTINDSTRMTVTGNLDGEQISPDSVFLTDCKFV